MIVVAAERIVHSCELVVDDRPRSASLVIVGLTPVAGGTRISHLEHYVLLVSEDDGQAAVAHQQGGVQLMLTGLQALLESRPTPGR